MWMLVRRLVAGPLVGVVDRHGKVGPDGREISLREATTWVADAEVGSLHPTAPLGPEVLRPDAEGARDQGVGREDRPVGDPIGQ